MEHEEHEDEPEEEIDALPNDVLWEMVRGGKPPDPSKRLKIFVYSLGLFLLAGILGWDMEYLVILAIVVFIHELGHVAAMKLLGYTNLGILFIPLLGGGASGTTKVVDPRKEAIVCLAGPFAGLGSSIVVLLFSYIPSYGDPFQNFALVSLVLNYINLLPFYPLDGGRFLNGVLFNRNHRMEFYFKLVTSSAFLIIALVSRQYWLAFFFLIIVFTVPATRREGTIVEKLKDVHDWNTDEITLEQVGIIKNEVLAHETNPHIATNIDIMAKKIEAIWKRIGQRPLPRQSRTLLLTAYILLFIVPLVLSVLIIVLR